VSLRFTNGILNWIVSGDYGTRKKQEQRERV
jgi:hypothetical protein